MNRNDLIQQPPPMTGAVSLQENVICDLSSLRLLRVTGEDRLTFLHGQLTRDLHKLEPGAAGLAAWCNPKGRVIATLVVCCAEEHIDLLIAADLKDAVLKRLRLFVLRAKVEISDYDDTAIFGVAGKDMLAVAGNAIPLPAGDWKATANTGVTALQLPGPVPRLLIYGDSAAAQSLWQPLAESGRATAESHWTLLNIEARLPWVDKSVTEQFLPQMLNLDQSGGLDFNKGCYPGQEVIARLHYRGEVKQRLQHGVTRASLHAGDALYTGTGERAGGIVNCAPHVDGSYHCLAVTMIGISQLHVGAADGAVVEFSP